jgi:hypothetical protein
MAENAWAVIDTEKPDTRRLPMTASWWPSVAGPGEVRVDIRAMAQG